MISGPPDPSLDLTRLEKEMRGFRSEVLAADSWAFRESYFDRGALDPYYILEFRSAVDDPGDDLYDQALVGTAHPALRVVNMTRDASGGGESYWRPIPKRALVGRLDRFISMFWDDCLQPPGHKGDRLAPSTAHDIFERKRFLFEIRSPRKGIIGVGPKSFAGVGDAGAVCGQVLDRETLEPLDEVTVQLTSQGQSLSRVTRNGGLFWFSRVPAGRSQLRVLNHTCIVTVSAGHPFGSVRGWLVGENGLPVENASLALYAPDGEAFHAATDASGKFHTYPLPAYPLPDSPLRDPYRLRVPAFLFTVRHSMVVEEGAIGGTACDETGAPCANVAVLLTQAGQVIQEAVTDGSGNFSFAGLLGGRYALEVPGTRIHARRMLAGGIEGRVDAKAGMVQLELLRAEQTFPPERTAADGTFRFDRLPPGAYVVRSKPAALASHPETDEA